MRRGLIVAAALVPMLTACGGDSETKIQKAYDTCVDRAKPSAGTKDNIQVAKLMTIGDDGHTLTIAPDQSGQGDVGAIRTFFAVTCALGELDAPDSVSSELKTTTPAMGRQTASWGDYKFTYSYSADDGLNAVITDGN